ncbi:DUF2309 domain-containing protein [Sphingomonas sp. BN140010]|uniref:Probable inorganic carbon transporter subunit DabA n=1 Tax=Sphingomonas arvum TaxID=2992113 RepID=A0ABT3JCD9_9SPHN|nr:DUF2309 domain-containing protein [Sphingomonas sp. BN140010]MCW3796740.1 DUF2309 domain-containing protein [Sphingomonas sp. BN140010]
MNKPAPASAFTTRPTLDETARLVAEAGAIVPPLWPLESAIAVNPLAGFEGRPFTEAVVEAADVLDARTTLPPASWRTLMAGGAFSEAALKEAAVEFLGGFERALQPIGPDVSRLDLLMARLRQSSSSELTSDKRYAAADALVAKWCGAFFAEKAANLMPNRGAGLFGAILPLLARDPDFTELASKAQQPPFRPTSLSFDPLEATQQNLASLALSSAKQSELMKRLVARLPGWAGHIRWRNEHAPVDLVRNAPAGMADLLALWTTVVRTDPRLAELPNRAAARGIAPDLRAFGFAPEKQPLTIQARRSLNDIASLDETQLGLIFMRAAERHYRDRLVKQLHVQAAATSRSEPAEALLAFCIDVRSEPIRRAIEAAGDYETIGYAGFFGLPIAVQPDDGGPLRKQLPVLLQPAHELREVIPASAKRPIRKGWSGLLGTLKDGLATTFTTAEASGIPAALSMLLRTFAPARHRQGDEPTEIDLDVPVVAQVEYAKGLFTLTGLKEVTSRLFVLVGHAGRAVNNPYLSALHCGACGGHPGGQNARLLATILNRPAVREGLAAEGFRIAVDTLFVAAEHDTTCDDVLLLDRERLPATHQQDVAKLLRSLEAAGAKCRDIRSKKLGCAPGDLAVGAAHWGEVRPEWGLAGNAAFVVGPRSLTKNLDLDGRAFLHSYDWRTDPDGTSLTTILTAPMVVAQWINCQYLFATVDNDRFGAGDKIVHNVLGGIGVVQGNGGDLRVGLPRQSLFHDAGLPFHVPQRLLTIVHAPIDRIETVIDRNPVLQRLFDNEWVLLVSVDPVSGKSERYVPLCTVD